VSERERVLTGVEAIKRILTSTLSSLARKQQLGPFLTRAVAGQFEERRGHAQMAFAVEQINFERV
jgi:hypothetical protein